uniref:Transposase n=1 Tax=Steinernema glaseri TaxID=37863 RepID=A0A1I8AGM2_9BILA
MLAPETHRGTRGKNQQLKGGAEKREQLTWEQRGSLNWEHAPVPDQSKYRKRIDVFMQIAAVDDQERSTKKPAQR